MLEERRSTGASPRPTASPRDSGGLQSTPEIRLRAFRCGHDKANEVDAHMGHEWNTRIF